MATITEDYVSSEVAKLLREKGFDQNCATYYLDGQVWRHYYGEVIPKGKQIYAAPTQTVAMKWLRKEHNILLFLLPAQENGKLVYLVEVWTWNKEEGIYESTYAPMPRKEPEQAVEAALKYCLKNLI